MTYKETLNWMFNKLPVYQLIGATAYKTGLDNTIQLLQLLDNPHRNFKSVHVAGTNGKGSTSHMLASVFQEAGYKTGLYTSPHLIDFRERIRINGEMIPEENVVQFIDTYKDKFEAMELSFFAIISQRKRSTSQSWKWAWADAWTPPTSSRLNSASSPTSTSTT